MDEQLQIHSQVLQDHYFPDAQRRKKPTCKRFKEYLKNIFISVDQQHMHEAQNILGTKRIKTPPLADIPPKPSVLKFARLETSNPGTITNPNPQILTSSTTPIALLNTSFSPSRHQRNLYNDNSNNPTSKRRGAPSPLKLNLPPETDWDWGIYSNQTGYIHSENVGPKSGANLQKVSPLLPTPPAKWQQSKSTVRLETSPLAAETVYSGSQCSQNLDYSKERACDSIPAVGMPNDSTGKTYGFIPIIWKPNRFNDNTHVQPPVSKFSWSDDGNLVSPVSGIEADDDASIGTDLNALQSAFSPYSIVHSGKGEMASWYESSSTLATPIDDCEVVKKENLYRDSPLLFPFQGKKPCWNCSRNKADGNSTEYGDMITGLCDDCAKAIYSDPEIKLDGHLKEPSFPVPSATSETEMRICPYLVDISTLVPPSPLESKLDRRLITTHITDPNLSICFPDTEFLPLNVSSPRAQIINISPVHSEKAEIGLSRSDSENSAKTDRSSLYSQLVHDIAEDDVFSTICGIKPEASTPFGDRSWRRYRQSSACQTAYSVYLSSPTSCTNEAKQMDQTMVPQRGFLQVNQHPDQHVKRKSLRTEVRETLKRDSVGSQGSQESGGGNESIINIYRSL